MKSTNFRLGRLIRRALPCGLLLLGLLAPAPARAQYFGRNKIQFESFDFSVLESPHFQILHYPQGSAAALDSARLLERRYEDYAGLLGYDLVGRQRVILYNNLADFRQTNVVSGMIGEGTLGVTEGLARRMVLPLTGIYRENEHVLSHELVHAFQFARLRTILSGTVGPTAQPPLWFIEGMAELMSTGRRSTATAMWMRDAVLSGDVPTLHQLSSRPDRYFPYRYGHALWAYISGTWGEGIIAPLFDEVMQEGMDRAVRSVLGLTAEELSERWQAALREAYQEPLAERTPPEEVGRRLSPPDSEYNLGPAISPDGRYLAFFSRRNPFTLDLFLADARNGEIIRRLGESSRESHYEALRFADSAGTWSPDGRTFAFVVFDRGDNAIALVDVRRGSIRRTLRPAGVEGIANPAWSPDGRIMAFTGLKDGVSDLYLLDLDSGTVEQLTSDLYAEHTPTWSPDGRTLAFVTDRPARAEPGREEPSLQVLNIGLLRVATGERELVSLREGRLHASPQFSPDGRELFLVADLDGYSDIYRYDLDNGRSRRVTRVATGVSGLGELAPCLSVSRQTGAAVFTVFTGQSYAIFSLPPRRTGGRPVSPAALEENGAAMLPAEPDTRAARTAPDSAAVPLEGQEAFELSDYSPGLVLLGAGQIGLGVDFSAFGASLTAPLQLLFGDLLGNHLVSVSAQLSTELIGLGGQVTYLDRRRRLNYGAAAGHIPTQFFSVVSTEDPAGTAILRETRFTDFLELVGLYPLSVNRRLELGVGYARTTFLEDADLFTVEGGRITDRRTVQVDAREPLDRIQGTLAYVGDYSYFGHTSPLDGRRYRFELRSVLGDLTYASVLADYREYIYLGPLSLAARALFFGRFLEDAEDPLLDPLSIGNPNLVRGYLPSTFGPEERSADPLNGDSPGFDRLFGSRIAVLNAELRLPLFGSEDLGLIRFPYLPTTLVAFLDAGLAWTSTRAPVFRLETDSEARIPVFSAGAAVRMALGGVAVLELYWAYPFQRPEAGWQFGVMLRPGF